MTTRHLHPVSAMSVADGQDRIRELLDSDTRDGVDEAIAALSQHLSAGEHVLCPVMRASGESGAQTATDFAGRIRALEAQLRLLQQANNGDSLARAVDVRRLLREIRTAFDELARDELTMLDGAHAQLSSDDWNELIGEWHDALVHAPTRPHPFAPHPKLVEAIRFRVVGWWDHLLDTLDARPVPRPRRSGPRRRPGRWGNYMLGGGHDDSH